METVGDRFRTRLLPALILAAGVALVGSGLLAYTSAVEPGPSDDPLASFDQPAAVGSGLVLPPGGSPAPEVSFPPDRVTTRVVVAKLRIDLPVMLQPPGSDFPLCDVAMYLPQFGQPGSGRPVYLYAHARTGMFLPLLTASKINNGAKMIGDIVQVYTSDDWLFLYQVVEVRRHTTSLDDAFADTGAHLWLQTSEGLNATFPKLQVVAQFVSAEPADPKAAHPIAHPRECIEYG